MHACARCAAPQYRCSLSAAAAAAPMHADVSTVFLLTFYYPYCLFLFIFIVNSYADALESYMLSSSCLLQRRRQRQKETIYCVVL